MGTCELVGRRVGRGGWGGGKGIARSTVGAEGWREGAAGSECRLPKLSRIRSSFRSEGCSCEI